MTKANSEKRAMTIYVQHANDLYKPVDLNQLILSYQQHQTYAISIHTKYEFKDLSFCGGGLNLKLASLSMSC